MSPNPLILTYKGRIIRITESLRKGKPAFWIMVNGAELTFVSKLDTATRIATNFVDVITGEDHFKTITVHNGQKGANFKNEQEYKKRYGC